MLEGKGTLQEPYIIKTSLDFQDINNHLSACFILTSDIVLNKDFEPIGSQFEPFAGVFDGNNYIIKGLSIKTKTQYVGLFSYNIGTIKNLQIEDSYIHATAYAGVIVGYNAGDIENCITSGVVSGTAFVGSIVGYNENKVALDCKSTCKIIETIPYSQNVKSEIEIFVSQKGSDTNDGSKDKPLKTIEAATKKVRSLIESNTNRSITVFIREGTYYIEKTIKLTEKDCFKNENQIVYSAFENENVNLIGGKVIENFESNVNSVQKVNVSKNMRYKLIKGFKKYSNSIQRIYVGNDIKCKYLLIDNQLKMPAKTTNWKIRNFDMTNVYAYYSHGWFSEILKVADIKHFKIKNEIPKSVFSHNANYLMGAVEFIKNDADWAIGADGYLYCKNASNHRIIMPMVKNIFLLNNVKNITIKNIHFMLTDMGKNFTAQGGRGKEGFDDIENTHAAICLRNSSQCTICDNIIDNCALNGISIQGSSTNNSIISNKIKNMGFAGIHCNGNWIDTKEYNNKHNYIKNNEISNVGLFAVNGAGIYILGSGHNFVCNNLIYDTPRYGISIKGSRYHCWPTDCGLNLNDEIPFNEHFDYLHSRNNLIMANHIYNAGKNSLDGGGIEAWGPGRDNVVDYNLVYNFYNGKSTLGWKGHGIFLDDATHYFTVTNNIVYESNKQGADASTFMKSIGIVVRNNIFDVTNTHQGAANISPYDEPCEDQVFMNNIVYADPVGGIGEDGAFIENGSLDRRVYTYDVTGALNPHDKYIKYLDKNLYYNTKGNIIVSRDNNNITKDILWSDFVKQTAFDKESINQDPLFVNAVNRNYMLLPESPAFKLGFKNIDMNKIGLCKDNK